MNFKNLNKEELTMENKKKILIASDDPRTPSGVGTETRYIAKGLIKLNYDVVVMAGAINHPNMQPTDWEGIRIYPVKGYGNQIVLRNIITSEQPDAIMLFTDPRYWIWAWQMENEIRTQLPVIYYNLWDDSPAPIWNSNYYKSCDVLLGISKQTILLSHALLKNDKSVELIIDNKTQETIDSNQRDRFY